MKGYGRPGYPERPDTAVLKTVYFAATFTVFGLSFIDNRFILKNAGAEQQACPECTEHRRCDKEP